MRRFSILLWGTLALSACHEHEETSSELADVIYAGGANDEALELLVATPATADPTRAAVLTWPADGESIPASTVPEFWWAIGGMHSSLPDRQRELMPHMLGPVRAVFGHGAPVNGPAHFVVFSTPANDKLVRVFTTELSFVPDAATWQKMVDAGAVISCAITTAVFENNLLAADGGPFQAEPASFTVTP